MRVCVCVCARARLLVVVCVRALACCCLGCSLCLRIIHFFRVWEAVGGRGKIKQREGGRGTGGAPKNMQPKQGGRIGNGAGALPAPEKQKSVKRALESVKPAKRLQGRAGQHGSEHLIAYKLYKKSPSVQRSLQKPAKELKACGTACVPSICVCCLIRVRMLSHLRMLPHTRAVLHAFRASVGIYEAYPLKEACNACEGMHNYLRSKHHSWQKSRTPRQKSSAIRQKKPTKEP